MTIMDPLLFQAYSRAVTNASPEENRAMCPRLTGAKVMEEVHALSFLHWVLAIRLRKGPSVMWTHHRLPPRKIDVVQEVVIVLLTQDIGVASLSDIVISATEEAFHCLNQPHTCNGPVCRHGSQATQDGARAHTFEEHQSGKHIVLRDKRHFDGLSD